MTLTDFICDTLKEVLNECDNNGSYNTNNKSKSSMLGNTSSSKKRLISEKFVLDELSAGRSVVVGEGDIVTPSARDILNKKR